MNFRIEIKMINIIKIMIPNQNDSMNEIDIYRLKNDDWQICRFLFEFKNFNTALNELNKSLKWKNDFGIYLRIDDYFPKEFYEMLESNQFGQDKNGRHVHWYLTTSKNIIKHSVKYYDVLPYRF